MKNGELYLVATPIGNLEDISYRAIRILKQVDLIAAEDTRQTLKLLNHYEIKNKLISCHRHNEETKKDQIIQYLKEGKNIAIVSDAGTPGISDPGEVIVKEAIKNNINVISIPGACAAINALVSSGLQTKEFIFYGFLPTNKKLRKEKFEDIFRQNKTIIIYEAPHRLVETLKEIKEIFGNIYIVLAKELTKLHEQFYRGNIDTIIDEFSEKEIKGEFVLIFENTGNSEKENLTNIIINLNENEQYEYYKKQGLEKKEIIKQIAKNKKVDKNTIYKMFIDK